MTAQQGGLEQAAIPDLPPHDPNWHPADLGRPGKRARAIFIAERDGYWRARLNVDDDARFEEARVAFQAAVPAAYRTWVRASDQLEPHWRLHPRAIEAATAILKPIVSVQIITPDYAAIDAAASAEEPQDAPQAPARPPDPREPENGPPLPPGAGMGLGSQDAYRVLAMRKQAELPPAVVIGVANVWRGYWEDRYNRATTAAEADLSNRKLVQVQVARDQILADLGVSNQTPTLEERVKAGRRTVGQP